MYARKVKERELTFDFAEGLIKNNLLFVDRETGSIWSQLHGKAISGQLKDAPLKVLPSMQTTWKHWRGLHPDTKVMVVKGQHGYPYVYRSWRPGSPRPKKRPTQHDISALGLGLVVNGEAIYFPFTELAKTKTPMKMEVGGETISVHYKADAFTAWAENARGELLTGVLAYRHGWLDFFPKSRIFEAD